MYLLPELAVLPVLGNRCSHLCSHLLSAGAQR